ncbi:MAG TPA: indolepyruvate ferredoxin oxidoreductase subunit alpha [Candidatus Eremiobacteraeota bacterium]|nr:MAG: 2-oxoacid ferredoxin oxidoreductase [bacterium ADurb.Bin363]HPZ06972.1 indolepyruvate ferredoxin oxidoreductase subunit alpha [Candidatus Eremiobacteraeota bacterium]
MMEQEILLGNGAIARGLIENGCHMVYSYPGTPSSEILPEVVRYKKTLGLNTYIEWSTNEKVAFDNAYTASITGKRSSVIMKQVGLNVASDSLMSSAYTGVKGGMIIVSCDDPGPHSSQTEQDSRFFAMFSHVPVFDPSDPQEAKDMVESAFLLSEKYEIPVIIRSTTRICHAMQNVTLGTIKECERRADFRKDTSRWAATPKFRYKLHKELNKKLKKISEEVSSREDLNYVSFPGDTFPFGIISSGVSYSILKDILSDMEIFGTVPVLKLGVPYPFPERLVEDFCNRCKRILILEDTDLVIEMLIKRNEKILGRSTGHVPSEGELTPEVVYSSINSACSVPVKDEERDFITSVKSALQAKDLPVHRPTLCPGCAHRASFFAIKKVFPGGIFPSDIGCYTLGINLGSVDTVLDMGAAITMASGFYQAYHQDGVFQPVIATIGDSTFYHSGTSALINAVYNKARFILLILDNSITAMTGMQPTAGTGEKADGTMGNPVALSELVRGCGVNWIREVDPYDLTTLISTLKEAGDYIKEIGIAVIIAKHNCILHTKKKQDLTRKKVFIKDNCTGCRYCVKSFECPALVYDENRKKVDINRKICIDCGVCADINVCPFGAIGT